MSSTVSNARKIAFSAHDEKSDQGKQMSLKEAKSIVKELIKDDDKLSVDEAVFLVGIANAAKDPDQAKRYDASVASYLFGVLADKSPLTEGDTAAIVAADAAIGTFGVNDDNLAVEMSDDEIAALPKSLAKALNKERASMLETAYYENEDAPEESLTYDPVTIYAIHDEQGEVAGYAVYGAGQVSSVTFGALTVFGPTGTRLFEDSDAG